MTRFWIRVLIDKLLKPRAPFLDGAEPNPANASRIIPSIPQYSLNLFSRGVSSTSGQALLDSITVGRSILNVFVNWTETGLYSPSKVKKELDGYYARYEQLLRTVPSHLSSNAPIERIEALAWQYVGELNRNIGFMRKYAKDEIDVAEITLDFAKTIGCEEALMQALSKTART